MFSRKKPEPPKQKRSRDLSEYGIFDIPDDFDPSQGDDDDVGDSDLEAELAAITAGGGGGVPKRPKPKPKPQIDLDKMVAESLRDIGSDEELSGDDDDPELLGELQDLTGETVESEIVNTEAAVSGEDNNNTAKEQPIFLPTTTTNVIEILKNRIQMYEIAENNAKATGETSRARRFNRGLKTLKDLLKQANAGKNINVDDIPPEVSVGKVAEQQSSPTESVTEAPSRPAPPVPEAKPISPPPSTENSQPQSPNKESITSSGNSEQIAALNARKQEYKIAAIEAKRAGDKETAIQFVKILKTFDAVIKEAENGKEIDLSDMPPPPSEFKEFLQKMQAQGGGLSEPAPDPPQPQLQPQKEPEVIPDAPKTILEGLQQRLAKYKSVEAAAKEESNTSKARRYGRIVKQYEDAIKMYKAGKPVAFDELPIPPGFGPLPTGGNASGATTATASPQSPQSPTSPSVSHKSDSPTATVSEKPSPPPRKSLKKQDSIATRISGNQIPTTLVQKQMDILLQRQKEFKIAALEAKKAGEIEQAKEYLKMYKGFETLLDAASGGQPVDLSSLPIPPSQRGNLEDSFALVTEADCDPNDDISDISVRLEEQLAKQLMMCKNTRDHHRAMGDVTGMNRFENLALSVQKDLDFIRFARKKKLPVPKFHYEQKSFNIVHCNTDLTDNEVEVNVIRGITYNVPNPKEVDTYVKIEFPYPQDDPYKNRTSLIKNNDSPDYDQKFKIEIQRSNRQCQRIFKRHACKFEVYSRGCCLGGICRKFPMCCFSGFLRSDILIGTVNVKLQPLETRCELHDSFNLMDGRKAVGGKLEVKIRLRNPILTKQIEHINEKWLVLDH